MKKIEHFMTCPAGDARLFTLTGGDGVTAEISDFGGVIRRLLVPGADGTCVNVALGYADPAKYYNPDPKFVPPHFGALVGRVGNRIAAAKFPLDGRVVEVFANERGNSLHGGKGFSNRLWEVVDYDGCALHLRMASPDGDAGYPGNLTVDAVYRVAADNALEMVLTAVTDAPTPVNLTNHNYFNLAGEGSSLDDQSLRIFASRRQEVGGDLLPTGKLPDVADTDWDFRSFRSFKAAIARHGGGFDDNFCLDLPLDGVVRTAAEAYSEKTGIRLAVEGNSPCVQLYTANGMNGTLAGTGGAKYRQYAGFCLEMQGFIDAPNHPEWPSILLTPGETYRQVIRFRFSR